MQQTDHARRLARAADVSRLEAERGFTENEEEKRMMVEEAANPALRYARQAKQEDLDEIKELNHRMNAARVLSKCSCSQWTNTWGQCVNFRRGAGGNHRSQTCHGAAAGAVRGGVVPPAGAL